MSLIDTNFADVPDLTSVKPGEYQLIVDSCEEKESKSSGNPMIMCRLVIQNETTAKDITHVMMLPTAEDDEKTKIIKNGRIKAFMEALGLPLNGFNPADAVGRPCWALLAEEETPDFGKQNRVQRFIKSR